MMGRAAPPALIVASACCLWAAAAQPGDWLVDPSPYRARVTEDAERRELVLDNGLARRVLRLTPNAATISLENLGSGEQMLRAVGPEARVTVDGRAYAVGGLTGQPVMNYLKAEWLADLRSPPGSYTFAGWTQGPIEPRLAWKKRPEWLAGDLPWPPPGRHVVLRFVPPAGAPQALAGPPLLHEKFLGALDAAWKVHASTSHPRASFVNEGKAGEIMALPDTSVYAERAWPAGAVSAEVTVDAGDDDRSNTWGPGLAVIAGDRKVSLVIRPHSQQYEVYAPGLGERQVGAFDRSRPCRLRVRLEAGRILFEAAQGADGFTQLASADFPRTPTGLRVGKVGRAGAGGDYPGHGGATLIRCHVAEVLLRGPEPAAAAGPRRDLPEVEVHHELYDGLPLLAKWIVVRNTTRQPVRLNAFVSEELRLAEVESSVNHAPVTERPNLWVETDYSFGCMSASYTQPAVHLGPDPDYPTQVHYSRQTPCLLQCRPPELGPDQEIAPGGSLESFRTFVLLLDSTERERRTLAQRRMYRVIAPWTQENPLIFHKTDSDEKTIRDAIDQAAAVGFEMVIMTFGSGFNFESRDTNYIARYKALADYGRTKGVALGGYSLLASRGAGTASENTQGVKAKYGVMPCLGAQWGRDYLEQIKRFCREAGLSVLEHDGSYPGDRCAATNHPHHRGLADSQWVMWSSILDLYRWCRAEGIYLNIPDWYFLGGANKCGMGYRETNWSLPRAEQELIERQNIFDGTWQKTPSMGWMFVPLSQYHGGGAAATIEPLHAHREHYEARLANLLGAGVQACYRGPRLFDTDETKALVTKWVSFYKAHREVLHGDLIHLRRANGQDWDGLLHVNPQGREKGLAFFYNPLAEPITRTIRVPLHYTGLRGQARVSVDGGTATNVTLDPQSVATLEVKIPARGRTWMLFK